jgi:hypothetical protein
MFQNYHGCPDPTKFGAFYGLLKRHAIFQSNLTGNGLLVSLSLGDILASSIIHNETS